MKRKWKRKRKTVACKTLEHLHTLASLFLFSFFLENEGSCNSGAERRTFVKFQKDASDVEKCSMVGSGNERGGAGEREWVGGGGGRRGAGPKK